MNPKEFKALWEWCNWADLDKRPYGNRPPDNAEFWRRFLVAISVYPEPVRMQMIGFMVFMNKED